MSIRRDEQETYPRAPDQCSDCGAAAQKHPKVTLINFCRWSNHAGKTFISPGTAAFIQQENFRWDKIQMRPGRTFEAWLVLCARCFYTHRDRGMAVSDTMT